MTPTKFLIDPQYGCCTSGELIALNRQGKAGYQTLIDWAKQEMVNRGIPVDEPQQKMS